LFIEKTGSHCCQQSVVNNAVVAVASGGFCCGLFFFFSKNVMNYSNEEFDAQDQIVQYIYIQI